MSVFTTLVLGLTCLLGIRDVTALGNVGCFFDPQLCLEEEHCFNDQVFGLCQVRGSSPSPDVITPLLSSSRSLLERELRRLLAGGYRWSHGYTQCVVQNFLHTERNSLKYDPGVCSRLLQLTLPEVAKEIVRDLESMGPEEQALIRFRPSLLESHPEFADELYTPLVEQAEEEMRKELEPFRLGQLLTKRNRQTDRDSDRDSEMDENRVSEENRQMGELRDLLEPLRDVWVQIADQNPQDDRIPDPEIPVVRTDLSSDLTRRPAYTEGGIQWLPIPADEATEEILAQTPLPIQDKQLAPPNDDRDKLKSLERQPEFSAQDTDGATSKQAADVFWRDVNEANNYKEPESFSSEGSSSTVKDSGIASDRDLVQALPEVEDLWRPMLEEEEEESDQEQQDSIPPDPMAFSRPMRYDIKKPGPGYYVHEPEDDTPQAQEKQMLALLRSAQREQEARKWESFSKTPPDVSVGSTSPPDSPVDEVKDEEARLQELVRQIMRSPEEQARQEKDETLPFQEDKREHVPSAVRSGPAAAPLSQAEAMPHPLKEHLELVDTSQAYLLLQETDPTPEAGERLVHRLERLLSLPRGVFSNIKTENDRVTFKVNPNAQHLNASTVAREAEILAEDLKRSEGLTVLAAGIGDKGQLEVVRQVGDDRRLFILTFILCGSVVGILLAVSVVYLVRRHARSRQKLQNLAQPDSEPSQDYQDLCRQRMQRKSSEKPEAVHRSSLPGGVTAPTQQPKRVSSLSQSENSQASPSSRSSTSSWSEEPVTSNMDISTGHMILSYMEDHLKNRDRLEREWEALCAYEAEPCGTLAATQPHNVNKNRYPDVLPYDHSRVVLNDLTNVSASDYINASTITDHDPRNPAYIATQGPLPHTAADFWQMIWEQGSVVAVTLSRLMENGVALCHRYWPEEGSEVYHIYEVHLVSEHIWCDDYLVRSFYLKNLKTSETRTVTQFHFLSWPENGVPASTKALLEFRRKVNKSYRGRSCPIVVHCSDGSGRTGTYCLIDMVLNRMAKGAKEIDIAATLEHIRDQRAGMVKTQAQFEFVLMAIAEEVHAILKALSN